MALLNDKKKLEKVSNCLLPYLSWNDLLRLRRTCKTTKRVADKFLQSKKIACNSEVEINEEDKTMSKFLQLNFHFTKFYLNNSVSGADFFETAQFQKFMDMHSMSITHLRLHQLSFYLVRNEFKFFLCLENLSHLEIGKIVDDEERITPEMIIRQANILGMPTKKFYKCHYFYPFYQYLSNLKYLKIGAETDAELGNMTLFTEISLKRLSQLSHVCVSPSFTNLNITTKEAEANNVAYLYATLTGIQERANDSSLRKLETFEFNDSCGVFTSGPDHKNLLVNVDKIKITGMMDIIAFFAICLKTGTSLENVNAALFNGMNGVILQIDEETELVLKGTGEAIRSLVNLHYSMLSIKMPNLERLVIRKTSQTSIRKDLNNRPHWPKLRVLRVHADRYMLLPAPISSTHLQDLLEGNSRANKVTYVVNCLASLWKFLFHQVSRPALRDLNLSFAIELRSLVLLPNVLPNVMDIALACPNLTRLTLTNWFGSGQSLVTLWKGLGALEEVYLDSCENVGNVTFVGEDKGYPVFLKLKNLKKLTLKGLERMPQITDLSFIRVFQNLKLKEFYLQSELPLTSITYIGIRSLLKGDFAKSIEKFPFNGFKLDEKYSSLEKLQFLEAQFRSSLLL